MHWEPRQLARQTFIALETTFDAELLRSRTKLELETGKGLVHRDRAGLHSATDTCEHAIMVDNEPVYAGCIYGLKPTRSWPKLAKTFACVAATMSTTPRTAGRARGSTRLSHAAIVRPSRNMRCSHCACDSCTTRPHTTDVAQPAAVLRCSAVQWRLWLRAAGTMWHAGSCQIWLGAFQSAHSKLHLNSLSTGIGRQALVRVHSGTAPAAPKQFDQMAGN
jgi:hypothetical protein